MRRRVTLVAGMLVATLVAGLVPASGEPSPQEHSQEYIEGVNHALRQKTDFWGEQVLARPEGPTFENTKDYLAPLLLSDNYMTESKIHYLPFTFPLDSDSYALHIADGGQIVSDWRFDCANEAVAQVVYLSILSPSQGVSRCGNHRKTDFHVGAGTGERFGSDLARLALPELGGGYLPILRNTYTDGDGTVWQRESFAVRIPETRELVSFVSFTATPSAVSPPVARLRVELRDPKAPLLTASGNEVALGDDTYVRFSDGGAWTAPNLTYDLDVSQGPATAHVVVWNTPAPSQDFTVDGSRQAQAREALAEYWDGVLARGARIEVPEPVAMDAMRNLLIQNLVMGPRYSVGNPFEYSFTMETIEATLPLGQYGFEAEYEQALSQLFKQTNGPGPAVYENWERGTKFYAAATHYYLTGDDGLLREHLPLFLQYLADMKRQRSVDPHGLLQPERYAYDVYEPAYGSHSLSVAWRGMRDISTLLAPLGYPQLSAEFSADAAALKTALQAAIDASSVELDDGSLFVPTKLFGDEEPYDNLTETRSGSYWNLVAPFTFTSGIIDPDSEQADKIFKYMANHGAWFLGMTRFNGIYDPPTPIGSCQPYGTAGYKAPGDDNAWGIHPMRFLSQIDNADRLLMTFYGKLAHGMTRNTFIAGEGHTIGPCPGEYYRSFWYPPNSSSNALYLQALRALLLREEVDADGRPEALHLAPATPRGWLADGKRIAVDELPTLFGPLSYSITSHLERDRLDVAVTLPTRIAPREASLTLRLPHGRAVASVVADDGSAVAFDAGSGRIDLTGRTGTARLAVTLRP